MQRRGLQGDLECRARETFVVHVIAGVGTAQFHAAARLAVKGGGCVIIFEQRLQIAHELCSLAQGDAHDVQVAITRIRHRGEE